MVKKILQLIFSLAKGCCDKWGGLIVSRFKLTAKGCNLLAERFGLAIHDVFSLKVIYFRDCILTKDSTDVQVNFKV